MSEEFGATKVLTKQDLQTSINFDCHIYVVEVPPDGGVLEFWDFQEEEWVDSNGRRVGVPLRAVSREFLREEFGGDEQLLFIAPEFSATIEGKQFVTAAVVKIRDARGNVVPMYQTAEESRRRRRQRF